MRNELSLKEKNISIDLIINFTPKIPNMKNNLDFFKYQNNDNFLALFIECWTVAKFSCTRNLKNHEKIISTYDETRSLTIKLPHNRRSGTFYRLSKWKNFMSFKKIEIWCQDSFNYFFPINFIEEENPKIKKLIIVFISATENAHRKASIQKGWNIFLNKIKDR